MHLSLQVCESDSQTDLRDATEDVSPAPTLDPVSVTEVKQAQVSIRLTNIHAKLSAGHFVLLA